MKKIYMIEVLIVRDGQNEEENEYESHNLIVFGSYKKAEKYIKKNIDELMVEEIDHIYNESKTFSYPFTSYGTKVDAFDDRLVSTAIFNNEIIWDGKEKIIPEPGSYDYIDSNPDHEWRFIFDIVEWDVIQEKRKVTKKWK